MRIFSQLKRKIRRILHIKKSYVKINKTNRIILGMVNKERKKQHIPPVVFDESLYSHAQIWSGYMAHEEELIHSTTALELCCNVYSYDSSPITITKRMFYTWKGSPPHWACMMNAEISRAGFAFANTKNGNCAYGAYGFK
jgi:uncharacterized protein YkwD